MDKRKRLTLGSRNNCHESILFSWVSTVGEYLILSLTSFCVDIIKLNDTAGQVERQFNSDNLKNILQYCSRQGLYS